MQSASEYCFVFFQNTCFKQRVIFVFFSLDRYYASEAEYLGLMISQKLASVLRKRLSKQEIA